MFEFPIGKYRLRSILTYDQDKKQVVVNKNQTWILNDKDEEATFNNNIIEKLLDQFWKENF